MTDVAGAREDETEPEEGGRQPSTFAIQEIQQGHPSFREPRATRARKRVSTSKSASAMVESSSMTLLMLIFRRSASSRRRSCFSSERRIVSRAIPGSMTRGGGE